MVARFLHTEEVTGSKPVSPTREKLNIIRFTEVLSGIVVATVTLFFLLFCLILTINRLHPRRYLLSRGELLHILVETFQRNVSTTPPFLWEVGRLCVNPILDKVDLLYVRSLASRFQSQVFLRKLPSAKVRLQGIVPYQKVVLFQPLHRKLVQ